MKRSVNLNCLWADAFVSQLKAAGIREVCISPGSRSTPLVSAFHNEKSIKKHIIIDERSSAFFALGRALKSNKPVAVVTTSGTAVTELYPAIVEAFQSRVPLIICTADRPPSEKNCGSNQTINQDNIFANHIRFFSDAGLPGISAENFSRLKTIASNACTIAEFTNRGPVHINFPFDKPLEPGSFTDEVEESVLKELLSPVKAAPPKKKQNPLLHEITEAIAKKRKGLVLCGGGNFNKVEIDKILKLGEKTGYPVLAEAVSGFRTFNQSGDIICNHSGFYKFEIIRKKLDPEIILFFGAAPVTKTMLLFFEESRAQKIAVNEFGDLNDPSKTTGIICTEKPGTFSDNILELLKNVPLEKDAAWMTEFTGLDRKFENHKTSFISGNNIRSEIRIISEIISNLPDKCNLFAGNSMPVRDIENLLYKTGKDIRIFTNRGASGIDGLISTALGIAAGSSEPAFLLIGDISFLHDAGSLVTAGLLRIPLNILLVNNGGGHIFDMLPVSKESEIFDKYFITPHNFDFEKLVSSFGGEFLRMEKLEDFQKIGEEQPVNKIRVFEFIANGKKSAELREELWKSFGKEIYK